MASQKNPQHFPQAALDRPQASVPGKIKRKKSQRKIAPVLPAESSYGRLAK